ncbi:MAG: gliding motility lipoprotein GldH [Bacteroidetes bacterium]|nr:MAG: gliding motility lipoprotein GldH [Bacteroidota bacterium]
MKQKILLLSILFFLSCKKTSTVYSKYYYFEKQEWASKDTAKFRVDIIDTISLCDVNIKIRHGELYPYSNLYVFLTTVYPDKSRKTDTIECILANSKGKWYGSGLGDLYDITLPIKKNVRFSKSGVYEFYFVNAMRQDPLPNISEFGFEIIRVSKNR